MKYRMKIKKYIYKYINLSLNNYYSSKAKILKKNQVYKYKIRYDNLKLEKCNSY